MAGRLISGEDVDTEELADTLRTLADAMDEGRVHLHGVKGAQSGEVGEAAIGTLELRYIVDTEYSDLLYPIDFDSE